MRTLDLTTIDLHANQRLAEQAQARATPHDFIRSIDEHLCSHCALGPTAPIHTGDAR